MLTKEKIKLFCNTILLHSNLVAGIFAALIWSVFCFIFYLILLYGGLFYASIASTVFWLALFLRGNYKNDTTPINERLVQNSDQDDQSKSNVVRVTNRGE